MAQCRREHQQQGERPRKRAGDEPGEGLVPPPYKCPEHIGRAEEKGIEHEIILRHEARQQRKPHEDAGARAEGAHQIGDKVHEHDGQKRQKHIHADHDHGGKADAGKPVENRRRRGVIPPAAELQYERVEHQHRADIEQPVQCQGGPLGKAARGDGGGDVEEPVVERRVHIVHLVIVDGAEVEALALGDADVIQKLVPREDPVLDAAVAVPAEEGGIA